MPYWPDEDGTYKHRSLSELKPGETFFWGCGPGDQADVTLMQAKFEAEIEAAGGLEAWRAQHNAAPQTA